MATTTMPTPFILHLPNEVLIAIAANVLAIPDLAALALTNRRLSSVARPQLYAAAARDFRATRHALIYFAENGFIEPVRLILKHGANPDAIYFSPVSRDRLLAVLAAQGRRPGRRPLIDRRLAIECIAETLRTTDPTSDSAVRYGRLRSTLFGESHQIFSDDDYGAFSFLIHDLQSIVTQFDSIYDANAHQTKTQGDPATALGHDSLNQWTALHVAAHRGDNELVKVLLDSGAAIDPLLLVEDKPSTMKMSDDSVMFLPPHQTRQIYQQTKQTPLHLAISRGHSSTAQLLLARGASTGVSSHDITAIHVAAWHGSLEICESLLEGNAKLVDERTKAQFTPFHYATAAGHLRTVGRLLLEKGADMHARFGGYVMERYDVSQWDLNVFTHALRTRRYSDALALMDMNPDLALPRPNLMHPVQACLYAQDISQKDEDQVVPILRRVMFSSDQGAQGLQEHVLSHYLDLAAERHLPQIVNLLLEAARSWGIALPSIDSWLNIALRDARSSAAIETVMKLIDHGVSVQKMPTPGLSRVFTRVLPPGERDYMPVPGYVNLQLTKEGAIEARLEILRLLYARLTACTQHIDDQDLRTALTSACQPGGLRACEWLSKLGALHLVDQSTLSTMLSRTALSPGQGGNDPELARWVLTQADMMGVKDQVLENCNVPMMVLTSGGSEVAQLLLDHGASPDLPRDKRRQWRTQRTQDTRAIFSCYLRQRVPVRQFTLAGSDHLLLMVCSRPDMKGAVELLRRTLDAVGEGARELVNSVLVTSRESHDDEVYTPASLVCCTDVSTRSQSNVPSEPARLAMLQILLDAGAEVHTLVERGNSGAIEQLGNQDDAEPGEFLWRALSSEDERESSCQQVGLGTPDERLRWRMLDWHKPMRCVIRNRLPTLARAILETRPLPIRNSPVALRYLRAACGGFERLSPPVLEILLDLANLDHADLPLSPDGETALMTLMEFCKENDFSEGVEFMHPDCRCEPELIEFEKDDLSNMVGLLLVRGAKWNTRSPTTGRSALDELRTVLRDGMGRKGIYKQHNLAELRKHIVLDIYSEGVDSLPDFNPFEWGDIKATRGSC